VASDSKKVHISLFPLIYKENCLEAIKSLQATSRLNVELKASFGA
jgi:hypothetical protein